MICPQKRSGGSPKPSPNQFRQNLPISLHFTRVVGGRKDTSRKNAKKVGGSQPSPKIALACLSYRPPDGGDIMSYPGTMNDEQLRTFGFIVSPDNPDLAYHQLYPNLSFRHRCSTCGNWSSGQGGKELECPQCFQGKTPLQVTNQYFKLYVCCFDDECTIRKQAFAFLREVGVDVKWGCHDGFGEYINLQHLKSFSEEDRIEILLLLNNVSVSKFKARKLAHPGSKMRSKLPKNSER